MKLKFIKPIEGKSISYNTEVETGSVIDVADWPQSVIAKALASGNWQESKEAIQATESGVVVEKPKAKKRK